MPTQPPSKPLARARRRLLLDVRDRAIEAMQGRGLRIIDGRHRAVCVVLPDADGWYHHAEAVRLSVVASDAWRGDA